MNLSAISLLIVLSGMFIIKYQVVKQENDTYIERSVIGRKICRDAEKPTNDS